jgi:hypothetical protein
VRKVPFYPISRVAHARGPTVADAVSMQTSCGTYRCTLEKLETRTR